MNEEKGSMVLYERAASAIQIPDAQNLRAIATDLLNSGLWPQVRGATQAIAIIATGQELGLGPTASLQYISIVNGKMCAESKVWLALFHKSGGKTKILKRDADSCKMEFSKPGRDPYIYEYTAEMAKTEGLLDKKGPWQTMRPTMNQWRCVSNGIRAYDPGVTMGISLTTEEVIDYPYGPQAEVTKGEDPNAGKGPETVTIKKTAQKPPKAAAPTPEGQLAAEKPKEAPKQAPATAKKPPTEPVLGGFEPPPAEDDIAAQAESPESSKEEEDLILAIKAGIEAEGVDQKSFKEWLITHQTKMKDPNKRSRVFLIKLGKAIRFHGANLEDLKYLKANLVGAFSLFHSPKPYGTGEPKDAPKAEPEG